MGRKGKFDLNLEIRKLIRENPDLPTHVNGVYINFIENPEGFLSVAIPVEWTSTHDQIRSSIDLALRWRDRLIEFQVPAEFPKRTELLLKMNGMRIDGFAYKDIAEEFNHAVDRHIRNYANFYNDAQAAFERNASPDFDSWFRSYSLSGQPEEIFQKLNWYQGANKAAEILKALKFSENRTREYIHKRLLNIVRGNIEPPMGAPLDELKIASILRSWKKTSNFKALNKLNARMQQAKLLEEKRSLKSQRRVVAPYRGSRRNSKDKKGWDLDKLRQPLDS